MNETFLALKARGEIIQAFNYLRSVGIEELHSLSVLGDADFLSHHASQVIALIKTLPEEEQEEHLAHLRGSTIASGNLDAAKEVAKYTKTALDETDLFEIFRKTRSASSPPILAHMLQKVGRKRLIQAAEGRLLKSLKEGNVGLAKSLVKTFFGRNLNLTERDELRTSLVKNGMVKDLLRFMSDEKCLSTHDIGAAMSNALLVGTFSDYLAGASKLQHETTEEELLRYLSSNPARRGCEANEILDVMRQLDEMRRRPKQKAEKRRPRP